MYYGSPYWGGVGNAPGLSYAGTVNEQMLEEGQVNQEEMDKILPTLRVLARCNPMIKLALVKGFMNSKIQPHIVTVTGDGGNDVPVLQAADVGVAMGIFGSQEAQDAANIIVLSDSFEDIANGIMYCKEFQSSCCPSICQPPTLKIMNRLREEMSNPYKVSLL